MRNFKKVLYLILSLCLIEIIAVFCLEPVTYQYYLEKDLEKLESEGKQPDVVLVGDSRIYRSFIPKVFDSKFGDGTHCTINTGTGSQTIQQSYYYLKDLLRCYPVKYAVVELTYTCFLENNFEENVQGKMLVLDRLRHPLSKLEFIVENLEPEEWTYLLKSYRYKDRIEQVQENIMQKLDADIRRGIDLRKDEHYADRGFVWTQNRYQNGAIGLPETAPVQWEHDKISEASFEYLDKIIDLCQKNRIELILVTGPTTLSTIYSVEEYEDSYQTFKKYAQEKSVPYFELNLLKNRKTLLPDSMMRDSDHVSGEGAEVVSELFCEILNAYFAGQDTRGWFYPSVNEMKRQIGEVIACDFHTEAIEGSDDRTIVATSLQEEGKIAEYEFWICRNLKEEKWERLQDYSTNQTCLLPGKELEHDIKLRVNSRLRGSTKKWESYKEALKEVGM